MYEVINNSKLKFCVEFIEAESGQLLPFLHLEFPTPPTLSTIKYVRDKLKPDFLQFMSDCDYDVVFTHTDPENQMLTKFQRLVGFEELGELDGKLLFCLETP